MGKQIRNIISFLILFFLGWYVWEHWDQLESILELKPHVIALIFLLFFFGTINNSRISQLFMGHFEKKVSLFEMVILQNATRLLNYLPMKFGTVLRANYLKRRYGIMYTNSVNMMAHYALLTLLCAGLLGFIIMLFHNNIPESEWFLILSFFFLSILAAIGLILIPLPKLKRQGKIFEIINTFSQSKKKMTLASSFNILISSHIVASFLLTGFRFIIIYNALGYHLSFKASILYGVIGFCSAIWGLTPGGLGIREILISSFSVASGLPLQVGLFAALLDRAIILMWVFTFGLGCTISLWLKFPTDFKNSP